MPFLGNVTRGRGIPAERLAEVGQHYFLFGGKSPINDQCRRLLAALTNELRSRGLRLPLYWGNRNWRPYLHDELSAIERDGHRRVLAVVTSAYPSYSSCRQYRENLFDAAQGTQVQVDRIRHYANHPGFVQASVDATLEALETLGNRQTRHGWSLSRIRSLPPWRRPPGRHLAAIAARTSIGTRLWHQRWRSALVSGVVGTSRATLSTARARALRASRGWSPTSTIICASSPRMASTQWLSCRLVSCPTTWRWSSTWTPRRQPPRRNAALRSRELVPPASIRTLCAGLLTSWLSVPRRRVEESRRVQRWDLRLLAGMSVSRTAVLTSGNQAVRPFVRRTVELCEDLV